MSAPKPVGPCPWCGRSARVCWILPCLSLQTALDTHNDYAMRTFAKASGGRLVKR